MKTTVSGWLIVGGVLGLVSASGATANDSCARVEIKSGSECSQLVVDFDLSACGDSAGGAKPSIHCGKTTAKVTLKGEKHQYTAKLKRSETGWGGASWQVAGDVTTSEIASAKAHHEVAIATTKTETAPAAAAPADAARTPAESAPALTFSGNFDGYYSYNFNRPANVSAPLSPLVTDGTNASAGQGPVAGPAANNKLRYYDLYHNQFTINLAELEVKRADKEVSFLVDLDFGHIAEQNAANPLNPNAIDDISKHFGQAYVTYTPSKVPGLVIDFGKMYTHVGYEVVKAKDNWQYSRSEIFWYGMPLWHTGLHVGYWAIPDKLSISGYVYNGWNEIQDYNSGKTLGAQVKWVPNDKISIIYNYIGGPEHANDNGSIKAVHELNATYQALPALAFAGEFLLGKDENVVLVDGTSVQTAKWRGFSLHAKYDITPAWYLSPRFEVFRDANGYLTFSPAQTPQPRNIYGYTLTTGVNLGGGLSTRLEWRLDHVTDQQAFVKNDGSTTDNQNTLTAAVLYSF